MNKQILWIFLCAALCIFHSCNKDETGEKLAEEDLKLEEFIKGNYPEALSLSSTGAYLVKKNENDNGTIIEAGDYILWNWTQTNMTTEAVEYKSDKSTGVVYEGSYVDGGPEIALVQSTILDEGIKHLVKGETADIYLSSRWTYYDFQSRFISIEIVEVIKELTKYQEPIMWSYLKCPGSKVDTIKLTAYDKEEYNIFYHISIYGNDKKEIDQNAQWDIDASYILQAGVCKPYTIYQMDLEGAVVKNIIDAVNKKNQHKIYKGGEISLAVPYKIVYKDQAYTNDHEQYVVPPNAIIIFKVKIS